MLKKIIIIGASSGLGRSTALEFARRGWMVGIAARRAERLEEIASAYPERIRWTSMDVGAEDAINKLNKLIESCGGMDVMLYAAGVGYQDPEIDPAIVDSTLMTNAVGFARIATAAYKYFRDGNRCGQIAAITSIAATKGIGISAAYSATKRFEQSYIEALDQLAHTQKAKIKFTDIRPGFIRTALLSDERSYPMEMTVEKVTPVIVKAIIKGRRVITIDWRWRIVTALWRMIPRWIWVRMRLDL